MCCWSALILRVTHQSQHRVMERIKKEEKKACLHIYSDKDGSITATKHLGKRTLMTYVVQRGSSPKLIMVGYMSLVSY